MWRIRSCAAAGLAAGVVLLTLAFPTQAEQGDPLSPLVSHAEAFLHREESGGITLDARHFANFPEHLRLTVVPQLAAFCDLYRAGPTDSRYLDIVERADFLARMGPNARSFDAADGMLAFALLRAFEITGNPTYRDAARPVIDGFLVSLVEADPNRALMAALALAQYHRLTSDPAALAKLSEIVLLVARSQHADGSFDHVCGGARDVHYTAWISMELDLIGRLVEDANVPRILDRTQAFLERRVGVDGTISYQDTLVSGATIYYYSRPACSSDYDTRGWVNELAYHALLFDRAQDARYNVMMSRLASLEAQGAWPDKWGYVPPANDPSYVWSTSPRSVIRTSVVFWALASIQARRPSRGQVVYTGTHLATGARPVVAETATEAGAEESARSLPTLSLAPNPARGGTWIALRLARAGDVRLSVLDASGRRIRGLLAESLPAGARMLRWDGRDQGGARAPAGIYFVRLEAQGRVRAARFALLE